MIKLSVITVAYKNSKVVVDLLDSIQKYNDIGDELEVIIVDNSPDDCRIEKAIKEADYKEYIYIPADNRGFGAGNNIGAAVAKGDILAFLNPDIILIEPIFKKILQKFADDEKLAWLGCQLLTKDGDKNVSFGYRFQYKDSIIRDIISPLCQKFGIFDSKRMLMLGADIFMPKAVFKRIGMFDEKIFMYSEEDDLACRVENIMPRAHLEFCSELRMIHLEGKSTYKANLDADIKRVKAMIYVCNKHGIDYMRLYKIVLKRARMKNLVDSIFRPCMVSRRDSFIKALVEVLNERRCRIFL